MAKSWIKNKTVLATTEARKLVLDAIEVGFDAIDTERVIKESVKLEDQRLTIKDQELDLTDIQHIYVCGFGKASCQAASALSEVLGSAIKAGVAIGLEPVACEFVQTFGGTHPLPSAHNVSLSEKIVQLSHQVTEKDLVITIVSGGGSALLCWPLEECDQSIQLYNEFLKTGGDISELNTVRKHLSGLKGGGLAKMLFPARVVSLIFSDIPGDRYADVASGPTYKDETTVADARAIINKYNLAGHYDLVETPKDDKYFEKVLNVPLVSNAHLLEAIHAYLQTKNIPAKIVSTALYDSPDKTLEDLFKKIEPGAVVLGAGEPEVIVDKVGGSGGRCMLVGIKAMSKLNEKDVFAAVASDGLDNSDAAGVVVDQSTIDRVQAQQLDTEDYQNRFDGYTYFAKLGSELLMTGPTQANVSDFFIFYRSR